VCAAGPAFVQVIVSPTRTVIVAGENLKSEIVSPGSRAACATCLAERTCRTRSFLPNPDLPEGRQLGAVPLALCGAAVGRFAALAFGAEAAVVVLVTAAVVVVLVVFDVVVVVVSDVLAEVAEGVAVCPLEAACSP
jgi:hypothetical protein